MHDYDQRKQVNIGMLSSDGLVDIAQLLRENDCTHQKRSVYETTGDHIPWW